MPDIIKLLPDSVANQIAAGEVIQRPASVVKELMENSVDAGSGSVKVIIKDAGKTLIQVIDDGSGMSETDARLAFERHATSKITTAHDLFAIRTKGFRGEALASIAAVSMVELKTRRQEDETGTSIIINGSKVESQEMCSCPPGSGFSVKSLFFNIPARRKFLKSDNTEIRHIINEFQKIALAHPEIRLILYHNDSEIYNLPGSNFRQRIIGLFGKSINQDLISLDTKTSLVDISGFIGKPENARRTFGEQFFFVNRRFMRHPYFHKAVMEAYQNILPAEMFPAYFIYLDVNPEKIDINIHPTKTEVKFEDERAIWQIIMASVREALGRFNIVPSLDFDNEALIDIPVRSSLTGIPGSPRIELDPEYNPFKGEERIRNNRISERFENQVSKEWDKLYPGSADKSIIPSESNISRESDRRLIQIKNKYIVCPVKSGLMIIDQKRAHERILYEKYSYSLGNNKAVPQKSLFPQTLELNPADFFVLKEIEGDMRIIGIEIQHLGNNIVSINSLPAECEADSATVVLEMMLEDYKSKQADPSAGIKEKLAVSLARASAVPYGKSLSKSEMENLFDTLFACKSPNYSPSGKPVVSIIQIDEIEKRFK
jgi:DNA mismatch repair protein MutL